MDQSQLSRRSLLKAAAAGAGLSLMVNKGVVAFAADGPPNVARFGPTVWKAWLTIRPDGRIILVNPEVEFGQGTATANAMLLVEELDADWRSVEIATGDNSKVYSNPRGYRLATDSSYGMRGRYDQMRAIGATARELLKSAAAQQWGVSAGELTTADSIVSHAASGRRAGYGELAEAAAKLPMPASVPLRNPATWRLVGKSTNRLDTRAKATGAARYAVDTELPGLLHAAFTRCPVLGGTVKRVDDSKVKGRKGVRHVFSVGYGVAVLADKPWIARKGAEDLVVEWNEGPMAKVSSATIANDFQNAIEHGEPMLGQAVGDYDKVAKTPGARVITADYTAPYVAHQCTEPTNCTAWWHNGIAEFWSATASMENVIDGCGFLYGLKPEQVVIHRAEHVGGSFGLRGRVDVEFEALQLSKLANAPVSVVRRREEDVQHSWYRPYQKSRIQALLGTGGELLGWNQVVAVQAINSHYQDEFAPFGADMKLVNAAVKSKSPFYASPVDYFAKSGTPVSSSYAIPAYAVKVIKMELPVPVTHWRSVGYSGNMFMLEGMIDECANAAGADPLAYRRKLYGGKPRQQAVLDLLKEATGWPNAPAGTHWGMAYGDSFESYSATAVAVSVKDKQVTVHRVVCVCDQGITVNPNQTIAQVEGGLLDGLATAFWGEITIENGAVQQSNFSDYRVFTLKDVPALDIRLIDSKEKPGSLTEAITPMVMPALVNAIHAATGERLRELPISRAGYEMAPPVRA